MVILNKNTWDSQTIVDSISWRKVKKAVKTLGFNKHRNKYNTKPIYNGLF